jgi:hypothetical protein
VKLLKSLKSRLKKEAVDRQRRDTSLVYKEVKLSRDIRSGSVINERSPFSAENDSDAAAHKKF